MSVSRRRFLSFSGAATTAALAGIDAATLSSCSPAAPTVPRVTIGKAKDLAVGQPLFFHYPDKLSPAMAVRMSKPVPSGVGPVGDIVAYSQICVHKGCPVSYKVAEEIFLCPCHYTAYDPGKAGEMIVGHAGTNLPRILLAYDVATDSLEARGIEGLLYGRFTNEKMS